MLNTRKVVLVILAIAALLFTRPIATTAWARGDNAQPRPPIVSGEDEVKQLLLLLDQDKNGKVSKQEFMKFMEAEFDRLDKDKSGELDVRELRESQVRVSNFSSVGK